MWFVLIFCRWKQNEHYLTFTCYNSRPRWVLSLNILSGSVVWLWALLQAALVSADLLCHLSWTLSTRVWEEHGKWQYCLTVLITSINNTSSLKQDLPNPRFHLPRQQCGNRSTCQGTCSKVTENKKEVLRYNSIRDPQGCQFRHLVCNCLPSSHGLFPTVLLPSM